MTGPLVWAASLLAAIGALGAAGCQAPAGASGSTPPPASAAASADSTADWSRHFAAEGAVGTFVVFDAGTGRTTRHDPARAVRRFLPASTFKVYNSLVALDQGVVGDVDSVWVWDGVERSIPSWNRDHTLRSGIENSVVWLYQRIARDVGRAGYEQAFAREPFGNAAVGDDVATFWLDGSLRVSADEQVAFMDALRRGALDFAEADQATARDVLPVLAEADGAVLRGKTGLGLRDGRSPLGWIVGWVDGPRPVVWAMNAEEAPGATFDAVPGRLRIVRSVLAEAGVFPDRSAERP